MAEQARAIAARDGRPVSVALQQVLHLVRCEVDAHGVLGRAGHLVSLSYLLEGDSLDLPLSVALRILEFVHLFHQFR